MTSWLHPPSADTRGRRSTSRRVVELVVQSSDTSGRDTYRGTGSSTRLRTVERILHEVLPEVEEANDGIVILQEAVTGTCKIDSNTSVNGILLRQSVHRLRRLFKAADGSVVASQTSPRASQLPACGALKLLSMRRPMFGNRMSMTSTKMLLVMTACSSPGGTNS
jgi:hypothetical protein